jgi:hypothetical protein
MRRTHLKGHENILKQLPVQMAGFNPSLLLRQVLGFGMAGSRCGRIRFPLRKYALQANAVRCLAIPFRADAHHRIAPASCVSLLLPED